MDEPVRAAFVEAGLHALASLAAAGKGCHAGEMVIVDGRLVQQTGKMVAPDANAVRMLLAVQFHVWLGGRLLLSPDKFE